MLNPKRPLHIFLLKILSRVPFSISLFLAAPEVGNCAQKQGVLEIGPF